MTKARDTKTLDMFRDIEPPAVVERHDESQIRAATLPARIARAVSATLKDFEGDRAGLASEMSAYLGERVTENMLNQYASQANLQHAIPAHRLIALAIVAGDARLINALLIDTGLIAVPTKYEALIDREMTREAIEKLQRKVLASDAKWRAGR
jgi:hypothetical protein